MRKRLVTHIADTALWNIVYFLPVVCYLLFLFVEPGSSATLINLSTFFNELGFAFVENNLIFESLAALFGDGGILPLFASDVPFTIFTWFICCTIARLAVEFLLFIPRLSLKWLRKCTGGEEFYEK